MQKSTGILVLGMHRSGTSALARVLNLGGADLGARVLGASAGNEAGHWEDAFAVETHERLLASFGTRWAEPFGLPSDLAGTEPISGALDRILDYLKADRSRHSLWAVKDPRLCLFAGLWAQAAVESGLVLVSVVVLRHPLEVARSLEVRDGIGTGHALLLWLESMLAAVEIAEETPHAVVGYDDLLEDWRKVIGKIGECIGPLPLDYTQQAAAEVDAFLDRGLRHHHVAREEALPSAIREIWERLVAAGAQGRIDPGTGAWMRERVQPLRELLHPYADEERASQRLLWERVGRAESRALDVSADTTTLSGEIAELRERTDRHRNDLVELLSNDIRRMQDMVAEAVRKAGLEEGKAAALGTLERGLAEEIASRLDELAGRLQRNLSEASAGSDAGITALTEHFDRHVEKLIDVYSQDIRRMQQVAAEAMNQAAAAQRESSIAAHVSPMLEQATSETGELRARIDRHSEKLVSLFSDDIHRMHEVTSAALEQVAASQREASIVADLIPRIELAAESGRSESEELRARIDQHSASLVRVFSDDIRRMQAVAAQATEAAAAARREMEISRSVTPALEQVLAESRQIGSVLERKEAECKRQLSELAFRLDRTTELGEKLATAERERDQLAAQAQERELALDRTLRELAQTQHEAVLLRERSFELDVLKRSSSWRLTKPLRVARRFLTGNWSNADSGKMRGLLRRGASRAPLLSKDARVRLVEATLPTDAGNPNELPGADLASLIRLAPQQDGIADVFVWAVIDWRFRTQRPQHLARALAQKGHRVFYISNNFVDSDEPGFRIDPLDGDGHLFQIHLHLQGAPAIYFDMANAGQVECLRQSLARLLAWTCSRASLSLVQHPYWAPLMRAVPNAKVVYDCMDHHAGFLENAPAVLEAERRLVLDSELVIVTSDWLEREVSPYARSTALIRNAGEFDFFRQRPQQVFHDEQGRRVIGYYGAIAEWFDVDLVRSVAESFPDTLVVLVGDDTARAGERLADLHNVRLTGEVPYSQLPYWLYGFDVCLLPFRVIPLTLATNPVKVYEYLSAGKAVVSVDLPELRQFEDLVRVAEDEVGFIDAVKVTMESEPAPEQMLQRQSFAAEQTWSHRAQALDDAIASLKEPLVSVIVLTYNNLEFTEACLFSIEAYSDYRNLEVIVVDNASSDGSREWLDTWVREASPAGHTRRLILNEENLGFSAGNNVGLRAATGEYLVILNNDTYVTPGWVRTLCGHFRGRPHLGLAGPVTNNIGNEARIEIGYADMAEMIARAAVYTRAHPGALHPLKTAAFFCVAMPRSTYETVGDMDERFGVGFFEDDDYCRRVEHAGFEIACADDVFVHHHLSASFDKLSQGKKQELFERNKAFYEAKWGPWVPHSYRRG